MEHRNERSRNVLSANHIIPGRNPEFEFLIGIQLLAERTIRLRSSHRSIQRRFISCGNAKAGQFRFVIKLQLYGAVGNLLNDQNLGHQGIRLIKAITCSG